jgi:hypothetical protein
MTGRLLSASPRDSTMSDEMPHKGGFLRFVAGARDGLSRMRSGCRHRASETTRAACPGTPKTCCRPGPPSARQARSGWQCNHNPRSTAGSRAAVLPCRGEWLIRGTAFSKAPVLLAATTRPRHSRSATILATPDVRRNDIGTRAGDRIRGYRTRTEQGRRAVNYPLAPVGPYDRNGRTRSKGTFRGAERSNRLRSLFLLRVHK